MKRTCPSPSTPHLGRQERCKQYEFRLTFTLRPGRPSWCTPRWSLSPYLQATHQGLSFGQGRYLEGALDCEFPALRTTPHKYVQPPVTCPSRGCLAAAPRPHTDTAPTAAPASGTAFPPHTGAQALGAASRGHALQLDARCLGAAEASLATRCGMAWHVRRGWRTARHSIAQHVQFEGCGHTATDVVAPPACPPLPACNPPVPLAASGTGAATPPLSPTWPACGSRAGARPPTPCPAAATPLRPDVLQHPCNAAAVAAVSHTALAPPPSSSPSSPLHHWQCHLPQHHRGGGGISKPSWGGVAAADTSSSRGHRGGLYPSRAHIHSSAAPQSPLGSRQPSAPPPTHLDDSAVAIRQRPRTPQQPQHHNQATSPHSPPHPPPHPGHYTDPSVQRSGPPRAVVPPGPSVDRLVVFYADHHVVPLPPNHRFPMLKYAATHKALEVGD